MLAGIKKLRITDPDGFIRSIRDSNPTVHVQTVNANFAAGEEHGVSVLQQSLEARRRGTMLSRTIEMDMLLRLACTNQISKALNEIGLKPGINDVLIIALGRMANIRTLRSYLGTNYKLTSSVLKLSHAKAKALCLHHKISKKEIGACLESKNVAGILAERANLLW